MGAVLDSTFLIDVLKEHRSAITKAEALIEAREPVFIPTPAFYEVLSGLTHARSRTKAAAFRTLAGRFPLLPFDTPAAEKAAEIAAELLTIGRRKSHVDVMIAAIALAERHRLITKDADFDRLAETFGLVVEGY